MSSRRTKTSQYLGVTWSIRATKKPWRARVCIKGEETHIGSFAIEREAAKAVDMYRIQRGLEPINVLKRKS